MICGSAEGIIENYEWEILYSRVRRDKECLHIGLTASKSREVEPII